MEKKKGRKKKIRFNYFLEKKIIIGICLFLVFVVGITTVLVITNKEDKELESNQNEVEKVIPAKCPYTLDEIEERITTNWLFSNGAFTNYREDATSFALVLLNFYKYFNKLDLLYGMKWMQILGNLLAIKRLVMISIKIIFKHL